MKLICFVDDDTVLDMRFALWETPHGWLEVVCRNSGGVVFRAAIEAGQLGREKNFLESWVIDGTEVTVPEVEFDQVLADPEAFLHEHALAQLLGQRL